MNILTSEQMRKREKEIVDNIDRSINDKIYLLNKFHFGRDGPIYLYSVGFNLIGIPDVLFDDSIPENDIKGILMTLEDMESNADTGDTIERLEEVLPLMLYEVIEIDTMTFLYGIGVSYRLWAEHHGLENLRFVEIQKRVIPYDK